VYTSLLVHVVNVLALSVFSKAQQRLQSSKKMKHSKRVTNHVN